MILAGDIGGTKSLLALYEAAGDVLRPVSEQMYRNADFPSLAAVLERFLASAGRARPRAACFAIAGPVIDGRVQMSNLPWKLDPADLAAATGAERVRLLNDLEGAAYGMLHLAPDAFLALSAPTALRRRGNVGLIAAGTGLGEALLCWDGERYHPAASEGGHGDFAPRGDEQIALLRHLATTFPGHVSYERVLSGPGLANVYAFLRDTGRAAEPAALASRLAAGDPAATIAASALAREHDICVRALDLFVDVYGAEAGNLALRGFTLGGLYVGGGIAPKLVGKLRDGAFMRAFVAKGRYQELLATIPVAVALDPKAALLGAAHFAARL